MAFLMGDSEVFYLLILLRKGDFLDKRNRNTDLIDVTDEIKSLKKIKKKEKVFKKDQYYL